jgi:hypothetical protein
VYKGRWRIREGTEIKGADKERTQRKKERNYY